MLPSRFDEGGRAHSNHKVSGACLCLEAGLVHDRGTPMICEFMGVRCPLQAIDTMVDEVGETEGRAVDPATPEARGRAAEPGLLRRIGRQLICAFAVAGDHYYLVR